MRCIAVGIILSLLVGAAWGQVEGSVESLGFNRCYRPNCWTPLRVRIKPTTITPGSYKLVVYQEDLDKDHALFSRPITIGKSAEAQEDWTYFIPQPTRLDNGNSVADLAKSLRVWLCTESGKQLVQFDLSPAVWPAEDLDGPGRYGGDKRGKRLVLVLQGEGSRPPIHCYEHALGLSENVSFQVVGPREMPESVLGYQSVDAILWMGVDPRALKSEHLAVIEQYVRQGGKLVVCQRSTQPETFTYDKFAAMLPVETDPKRLRVEQVDNWAGLSVLRRWMKGKLPPATLGREQELIGGGRWAAFPVKSFCSGPGIQFVAFGVPRTVPVARATPKAGAVVAEWLGETAQAPYLVRWLYGYGTVTWVAQDFGEDAFRDPRPQFASNIGWEGVWDRVFDWGNHSIGADALQLEAAAQLGTPLRDAAKAYDSQSSWTATPDLSRGVVNEMELPHRGVALVGLAVTFFIIYWLAAGPGSYWFLLRKKRAYLSWFAYGACALAATGLTVLVVRLVLGGASEVHHVTFVRWTPGQDAVIQSDIGLYIPRDGVQEIELAGATEGSISYLTPFPLHPDHLKDSAEFTSPVEYDVPIRDRASEGVPNIKMPYRSTLKKLQASWVGHIDNPVTGSGIRARKDGFLSGTLTNQTGRDLHQVVVAYHDGREARLVMVPDSAAKPAWPKGSTIDLRELSDARFVQSRDSAKPPEPLQGTAGEWAAEWSKSLYPRAAGMVNEDGVDLDRAFTLMSLFECLPPSKADGNDREGRRRYELLRPAGRNLDVSGAIGAGQLVILAQSDRSVDEAKSPLPFPLQVRAMFGADRVAGEGMTFYQFILPMDRSALPPTTFPVE